VYSNNTGRRAERLQPPAAASGASSLRLSAALLRSRGTQGAGTLGSSTIQDIDPNGSTNGNAVSAAAIAINNAGVKLTEAGKYNHAISEYTTALGYAPQFAIALNNRGVAYAYMGQYEMALSDFNSALRYNPYYSDAEENRKLLKSALQLK
jgi:tetratricopeptide (TPR) repeat protein